MTYPSISTAQWNAVVKYAFANGRSWKTKLINDWMSGRCQGDLQQLRNSHGPRWLKAFKLPVHFINID